MDLLKFKRCHNDILGEFKKKKNCLKIGLQLFLFPSSPWAIFKMKRMRSGPDQGGRVEGSNENVKT